MSEIFNLRKLYRAYLDCRRTKRKTVNALNFEWDLEKNLFKLEAELLNKEYKPSRSICFIVENPTPREIFAADFRDRVIHHLLINEIEEMGERALIFDTFSCRKGKGTHLAVKKLKRHIKKATKNHRKTAFYAQLDISGFFMSIDHNILYGVFSKLISRQNKSYQWKEDILWLARKIIFHKPINNYVVKGDVSLFDLIPSRKSLFYSREGSGFPIGNYSSQFFANLYLNEMDQFIKRKLKCKYYVRYVDDFILLDSDKERLKYFRDEIRNFLEKNLALRLSESKTKMQSIDKGIDFLGYFIKPMHALVRRKVVGRLKNKLYEFQKNSISDDKILATINSYYGHFRHAASFRLREDIYENYLAKLRDRFELADRGEFLTLLNNYQDESRKSKY